MIPRLSAEGERDLAEIYAWIYSDAPAAAERFLDAFRKTLILLCEHPLIGRRRHFRAQGLRSWRIKGFENYLVFYCPTSQELQVVRVLHGARDLRSIFQGEK
jgi:toxin ParE1/3/4